VLPVPAALGTLAVGHKLVVTMEDNGQRGGVGSAVSAALRAADVDVPCRDLAVPQRFLDHAARGEVLEEVGLTERNVARQITGWVAALGAADESVARQLD
jgi:1-deoxy-D-xylulose-5-phosphate synthase